MISGVLLGIVSVLQAGMNRKIGETIGIPFATVFNNTILLVASVALALGVRFLLKQPQPIIRLGALPLWYLVPGLLGLVLVAGIPYAIGEFGAVRVFIPLIFSQVLGSLLWDLLLEGKPLSLPRVLGAAITCAGALLCQMQN